MRVPEGVLVGVTVIVRVVVGLAEADRDAVTEAGPEPEAVTLGV